MYQTAAEFVFSRTSNGAACMGEGWSAPEERSAWSVGDESHLTVPVKPGEGDLMLEIAVTPFQLMPFARRQRLSISVNGVDFPEESVASETSIGIRLPAAQFGDCTSLAIRLRTPDSLCPAEVDHTQDRRKLGVALREVLVLRVPPEEPVKPRTLPPLQILDFQGSARDEGLVRGLTGLSSQALMMQMESLGHNCEFGLVQRRCGAEPTRLLRFAGITYRNLLLGLDFGFEGVDDPAMLRCFLDGDVQPEYMVRNDRYGMHFHTFLSEHETTPEVILAKQVTDMKFRRRNFIDMLSEGNRLFVFQRPDPISEAQALPLLTMLQSYGRNALLFVSKDPKTPPGTVRMLRKDLFQGSIDRLAPVTEADRFNLTAWVSLCANAYRLWRENGGGA